MRKYFAALLLIGAAAAQPLAAPDSPQGTTLELGLAGYAKVLCSAVFVSMRDPAEAFHNSGSIMIPENQRDGVHYNVDRQNKQVSMTRGSITRVAKFHGDQGCIIESENDGGGIHFTPVAVKTALPDAATLAWPMGDQTPAELSTSNIDRARVAKAVDLAFADPEGLTAAFVVVYKGNYVLDRLT